MSPLSSDNATTRFIINAAEHPIDTVTVFRSSNAQIVRTLDLDLKSGNNEIEINGLSSSIDTESLRVSGLGGARLADVVCVVEQRANTGNEPRNESQQVHEANIKVRDLKSEKEAREAEVDLLLQYGKALGGTTILPDQVSAFAQKTLEKRLAVAKTVRQLDNQIEQLEQFIRGAQRPIRGDAKGRASITIVAEKDGPAQLTISYLVKNVLWAPTYDLHATSTTEGTPSSSVILHYRVHLSQVTGEHWNNTSLILSTAATDSLGAGIPQQRSLSIAAVQDVQQNLKMLATLESPITGSVGRPAAPPVNSRRARSVAPKSRYHDLDSISEGVSFVTKSPLSVSYVVEGKSNIFSDSEKHKVSVVQLPFEAKISHVTVPRQHALAYLQCEVKNTTDYHLLPGPVSVFMNDGYVSKTSIPDINTGDMFRCTLGIDSSTRISYNLTSKSETSKASPFAEQYKTVTYTSTTTIHNRHAGESPISIIEKSSIPVAPENDTRIRVFLRTPEELAESEDGEEVDLKRGDGFKVKWSAGYDDDKGKKKEGKFIWFGKVESGKEVTLVSEWDVRAPVDVEWEENSS